MIKIVDYGAIAPFLHLVRVCSLFCRMITIITISLYCIRTWNLSLPGDLTSSCLLSRCNAKNLASPPMLLHFLFLTATCQDMPLPNFVSFSSQYLCFPPPISYLPSHPTPWSPHLWRSPDHPPLHPPHQPHQESPFWCFECHSQPLCYHFRMLINTAKENEDASVATDAWVEVA